MMIDSCQETIDLGPFKNLMLRTCGFIFENEREITLDGALRQRMMAREVFSAKEYLAKVIQDKDEFNRLVELLTVNETYFFRETDHLNLMAERLLPELIAEKKGGSIRILSAGCSTGEEPYSVAMLLRDKFGKDSERLFTVAGVDIDAAAIDRARQGVYGKGSFRGVDRTLLDRYFEPCAGDSFQVREFIRRQVEFEVVNLLGNFYPHCMQLPDVILYRNVSIYFPKAVQHEIFQRLSRLLTEGGYFLVGATETMHHDIGILSLVQMDSLFVYQKIPGFVFEDRRKSRRGPAPLNSMNRNQPNGNGVISKVGMHASGTRNQKAAPVPKPSQSRQAEPTPPGDGEKRRLLFDECLDLARTNRFEEALANLDMLLTSEPTFVKALSLEASILLTSVRFDEARTACTRAIEIEPLCIEGHLMLGIIARHQGSVDEAFSRFRQAVFLNNACWLAHFYLAEIVFARGDKKRARGGYETTIRILESGSPLDRGQEYFPISFNSDQFLAICRHKLSLLNGNG